MAEGTTYEIDVQAKSLGADATADQVLGLSDAIEAAERVLTPFDSALAAASAQLDAATAAADAATQGLAEAEAEYKRLERAATAAAKKVERAMAKGGDTTALQAAATEAAAAVTRQAAAVDAAAQKAKKATAAQRELADAYKTVEKRAARAANETRGTQRSFGDLFGAAGALGGPLGGLAGQISGIGDGLRAGGLKGGLILGAFAAGNAFIAWAKAAVGLTLALGGVVAGLLAFAVASDKATSKKLSDAWEKAKKSAKGLFEGVNTEKLVKPVENLLKLLDKNTSVGKGLSHIFETLLNPVIDGLDEAGPRAEEFIKGLIIGALKAIIFMKQMRNAIVRAVPKEVREKIKELVASLFSLESAASGGEMAFKVLGLVLAALLIPVGLLIIFFAMVGVVLVNMVYQAEAAYNVLKKLAEYDFAGALDREMMQLNKEINQLKDEIMGYGTAIDEALGGWPSKGLEAAGNLIEGLIEGITKGAAKVATAAAKLGKAAIDAIKNATKSSSPSKIMVDFGHHDFAGAVTMGIEKGQAGVKRSASKLGRVAVEATSEQAAQGSRSPVRTAKGDGEGRGKVTHLHLHEGAIVINGARDEREMAARVKEVVVSLMEGEALQMGAGETVAA